jgi:hypothetical protein
MWRLAYLAAIALALVSAAASAQPHANPAIGSQHTVPTAKGAPAALLPVRQGIAPTSGPVGHATSNVHARSAFTSNVPGSGSLAGNTIAHHTPTPATIGGPVANNDARRNLVAIGTGMRHR